MKVAIIVSDRYFVKIVDGKEVDIKAEDIKQGEKFSVYNDSSKLSKNNWDGVDVFTRSEEPLYTNDDDVTYITCEIDL